MMIQAAKQGWAGHGAGLEQARSKAKAGRKQDRNRAGVELSRLEQGRKRVETGQELGRSWEGEG